MLKADNPAKQSKSINIYNTSYILVNSLVSSFHCFSSEDKAALAVLRNRAKLKWLWGFVLNKERCKDGATRLTRGVELRTIG